VTGAVFGRRRADELRSGSGSKRQATADAARTDVGLVRSSNEDAFVRRPDAGLWAVADGMGGHEGGEWAAAAIARALEAAQATGDFDPDCASVAQAVRHAHQTIYARAAGDRLRMGSTVVALLLGAGRFAVFWVGDSRAYRLRAGALVQLTRDHTQVQSRVDRGLLSLDEARSHPMAHVLTRAVGVEPTVAIDRADGEARPGDTFLLCSDGLHGVVADAEIAEALSAHGPAGACETLLALCRARGAPDNVTMVVVAC
jgi:serine/threonine-protein phosphatase Stp1